MTQVTSLHKAGATARLLPHAGGRVSALRLMTAQGRLIDVLYPYPEDFFDPVHWAKGGIYPLVPYSNRIANAQLTVDGQAASLKPHPDALPHTLHGNAHAQAWQLEQTAPDVAVMTLESPPSAAWPWAYQASQRFELTASQLSITLSLTNVSANPMPAGLGLHPYFLHEPGALLKHNAAAYWPADGDFLPDLPRPLMAAERYEPARCLPPGTLTDYFSDWNGQAGLDLPCGAHLSIACDLVFGHLVVHRPPTDAYLCVEPVSHVANGFNLAARGVAETGTRFLEPGETLQGQIRFSLAHA